MSEKRKRPLTLYLDEDLYKALVDLSSREGFSSLSDFVIKVLRDRVSGFEKTVLEDTIKTKISRIVQDEINKHMQLIESLRRQVADLYERVESIQEIIEQLRTSQRAEEERASRKTKKTGIERLKEDKVVFESTLPMKINREAFFNYLEREGAVIIVTSKERIAVDPEFWNKFKDALFDKITTNNEDEIRKLLGDKGFILFQKLREDNQVIYDPLSKRWRNLVNVKGVS
ncbi:CopG family transcriptional regulator [Thermogladius sp. 4427co]|uniref:CopG family transcriptional regulator n=1 Tax=Thermogladius sp. 4427co TaxID=3450718 RepID=UPI003F795EFE